MSRLSKVFKFKTEMVASKALIMDSTYIQSEVYQLKDNVDGKPQEFLSNVMQC